MNWLHALIAIVVFGSWFLWASVFRYREVPETKSEYVIISVYNAVAAQTDSTPLITADGGIINPLKPQNWIAVSEDLLERYPMGTCVIIDCDCPYDGQEREVRDKMSPRFTNRIDILTLSSYGIYAGTITRI